MALTKIRGNTQIMDGTIANLQIAADAAIQLSKLEKSVLAADGSVALTGNLNLASHRLVNVATPLTGSDAANKSYVDSISAGLDPKQSCRAATTATDGNITLTAGPLVLDTTVTLAAGDRILVKNQTNPIQNGIYIVGTIGGSDSGTWTRATDCDNTPDAEFTAGLYTFIEEGTTNEGAGFVCVSPNSATYTVQGDPYGVPVPAIELGVDDVIFSQFSGAGQLTAGTGISIVGGTISNTDTGSAAVSTHESSYTHANIHASGSDNQNLWATIAGDTGSTAANSQTDTLTVAGGTGVSTAVSGDTLTVTNTDTGSAAVTSHNSAYDHTKIHDAATAGSGISVTGQAIAVKVDDSTIEVNGDGNLAVKGWSGLLQIAKIMTRDATGQTPDGSRVAFTLAYTPESGTESVYLNGILQDEGAGNDYTISGATITFTSAPLTGDKVRVSYISQ